MKVVYIEYLNIFREKYAKQTITFSSILHFPNIIVSMLESKITDGKVNIKISLENNIYRRQDRAPTDP
ncbi:MAG: hypothetical protein DRJ37_01270 [Thermoprotei archaeon]|nr:MAG: hypothetical protein DRJ37_01270 [Thermoprotei archaeon]